MASVPRHVARQVVLREFPRVLRVGLGYAGNSQVARDLAAEAGALDPKLRKPLEEWIERGCPLPSPEVGLLDHLAAAKDVPVATEIADALLMLGTSTGEIEIARRLSRAAWKAIDRLPEAGSRLHQLALASASAQAETDGDGDEDEFVVDIDTLFEETFPADGERRKAATVAWREALGGAFDDLKVAARDLAVGLALLGVARAPSYMVNGTFSEAGAQLGRRALEPVEDRAAKRERERRTRRAERRARATEAPHTESEAGEAPAEATEGFVVVCPAVHATGASKAKDVTRGYEHAIGKPLALVPTPDLPTVRRRLLSEFPYATDAVDRVLGKLVGKRWVQLPPLLLLGRPGGGKSLFGRRLGEELGIGTYRVDGTGDAGASLGGTERRWYTAEPCRAFMAMARFGQANPLLLIDEVDKAPTRADYGNLWNSLIPLAERETARRYPDPALQVEIDASNICVVCTANDLDRLPAPLVDRLTVVTFPLPKPQHLDALLPALVADIARDTGIDARFLPPLDQVERDVLRRRWRGGSARRLKRLVEGVLRARERMRSEFLN